MSFSIRPATVDDAAGIASVHRASIVAFGPRAYLPEEVAAWAGRVSAERYPRAMREGHRFFVAEEGGRILGFSGHRGDEISALYVHPEAARRGVGAKLLEAAERAAAATGATRLRLTSSLVALSFYERHGWVIAERLREPLGETGVALEALKMTRTLAESS